jgi:nitrate reductase gamma subunit
MDTVHLIVAFIVSSVEGAYSTSPLLHFAEDKLQIAALSFMFVVYVIKVWWVFSFKAGKERQAPTGHRSYANPRTGIAYSLFNIFMPWGMSSYRQHPLFYLQFGIFHVAVAVSIAMSLIIPYVPELISHQLIVLGLQALFATACLIGLGRFIRRIVSPYMRAISSLDDYFAVGLLTIWFAFAFMAAPNHRGQGVTEFWLLGYFFLTAFFISYVPFSKISHYIYYPFTRWYLGKTLGYRGVYPLEFDVDKIKREFFKPNEFNEGKDKTAA